MQTQDHHQHRHSRARGIYDATRELLKEGGVRGLFRGTWPTLARDVPGFAAYFVAYEVVRKVFEDGDVEREIIAAGMFEAISSVR